MFYLDHPDNQYPELRVKILDIVLNNIFWAEEREADMEKFFYDELYN